MQVDIASFVFGAVTGLAVCALLVLVLGLLMGARPRPGKRDTWGGGEKP